MKLKIPGIAISRLSIYARNLEMLDERGMEVISSVRLADICGINPAQIRKDLAYFGAFGVRGVGYYVKELLFQIRKILGLDTQRRLGLVGVGNLGSALLRHAHFVKQGYEFVAAFDRDPKRTGLKIGGVTVAPLEAMNRLVKKSRVDIGVVAASPDWAQMAADRLVAAGVRGLLNFAPVKLHCPVGSFVENVDFSLKFDVLSYKLSSYRN